MSTLGVEYSTGRLRKVLSIPPVTAFPFSSRFSVHFAHKYRRPLKSIHKQSRKSSLLIAFRDFVQCRLLCIRFKLQNTIVPIFTRSPILSEWFEFLKSFAHEQTLKWGEIEVKKEPTTNTWARYLPTFFCGHSVRRDFWAVVESSCLRWFYVSRSWVMWTDYVVVWMF